MYMFYDYATGYLHTESGRMVDNYDTLEAAALAWADAVMRVRNFS